MTNGQESNGREERRQAGIDGDWICVGAIAGSHGVRGDIKLKSFTDGPDAIFTYSEIYKGPNGPLVSLKKVRVAKDSFVVRLEGVETPEEAQALKSTQLFVSRASLPQAEEDEFYLADLIGLIAFDDTGAEIGFVRAVENFGSEDLLELVLNEAVKNLGRQVFVPFRKVFVPTVNIAAGSVTIAFDEWQKIHVSERDTDGDE
tara:strand:- start:81 stop:686 length:606 start_codon:yes stop_codon:yes gene_type:complete